MTVSEYKRKKMAKVLLQKSRPLQKISNNFIDNTIKTNELSALKTIYYLASILEDSQQLKETKYEGILSVSVDLKKMLKYTELTLPTIKRNLKKMQETSITFIDEVEDSIEGFNLLPRYKIIAGKSIVEIDLYQKIANMIVEVSGSYTFLNTKELMKIKNKHSLRLLPLLHKVYNNDIDKRYKRMTLEDLNEFFGTKYTSFSEIERRILKRAKEEINTTSKMSFTYEVRFENLGKGRPRFQEIIITPKPRNNFQGTLI